VKGITNEERDRRAKLFYDADLGTVLTFADVGRVSGAVFIKTPNSRSPHLEWRLLSNPEVCRPGHMLVQGTIHTTWWLS